MKTGEELKLGVSKHQGLLEPSRQNLHWGGGMLLQCIQLLLFFQSSPHNQAHEEAEIHLESATFSAALNMHPGS